VSTGRRRVQQLGTFSTKKPAAAFLRDVQSGPGERPRRSTGTSTTCELLGLAWEHLDLDAGRITVVQQQLPAADATADRSSRCAAAHLEGTAALRLTSESRLALRIERRTSTDRRASTLHQMGEADRWAQGISTRAVRCLGRTTAKSRWLRVATVVSARRSDSATTEASTSPSFRFVDQEHPRRRSDAVGELAAGELVPLAVVVCV